MSTSYSRMDDDGGADAHSRALVIAAPPVAAVPSISSSASTPPTLSSPSTPRLSSPFLSWLYQLLALWKKSLYLLRQQVVLSLTLFLLPVVCVLITYGLSQLVRNLNDSANSVNHSSFSTTVDRCSSLDVYGQSSTASIPCTSLTYSPNTPDTADIIARTLAATSTFTLSDTQAYPNETALLTAWTRSVASQDVAIIFHNATASPYTELNARYTLYYNQSSPNADWRALAIQFALEQAIANTLITNTVMRYPPSPSFSFPSISLNGSASLPFRAIPASPLTPSSLSYSYLPQSSTYYIPSQYNDGASQYMGGSILALCVTILTLLIVQNTTAEKQSKILAMLRMNGLFDSAYWVGVLLCYAVIWLVASLLTTLVGLACGLQVYVEGSFAVHWLSLFLFMSAMSACGLFIASLVSRPRWVNLISFIFLAVFVAYSFIISTGDSASYSAMTRASPFFLFVQYSLPVAHWDKLWLDMSYRSQYQTLTNQTDGSGYTVQMHMTWAALYQPSMERDNPRCRYLDYDCCTIPYANCLLAPAPGTNLGYLLLLTIVYTALAWYCSQIGDELSGGKKAWFIFTPSYWTKRGTRPPSEHVIDGDTQMREKQRSGAEQSIRTVKLSKDFKGTTAVKELTLTMQPNEVFCLLGHNGAGKTTTINLLTGLYAQTFGEAYVCGFSIRDDIAQIQQILGVCTQENILWDQLTVLQHLHTMAAIRCIEPASIASVVENRLQLVNLWEHRLKKASELSGGMKRRLSIALALMGDPRVLFLDEPTTGMDPVHRNEVWDAIRQIKAQRVVCLTTHAMDEADQLGDRIGLLATGRLRALGTSLYLKNHFGQGYQLQLLVAPQDVPQLTQAVEQYLVGCTIVGKEAGAVTIALKRGQLRNVPLLFKWIEGALSRDATAGKGLLKEWSISNSTLEEVFLRLCAADNTVNTEVEGVVDTTREETQRLCAVCHARPVSVVTLYTAGGVPVILPNVMCGPCAWGPVLAEEKAREEAERALLESKEAGDGERIDWSLNPDGSVASNGAGGSGSTLPTDPSSPSPSSSLSESIQNSVGKTPPTLWQQVRSIFLKNLALAVTEWKGWLLRLAILILMVAMVVLFASVSSVASFMTVCPQGYLQPNQVRDCTEASMRAYLFTGQSSQSGAYGWTLDQDAVNVSGGVEPAWLRCSSLGYCWTASMLDRPNVMVYSADGPRGLAGFDLGWGAIGWNASSSSSTASSPSFVDWTALLQSTGLSVPQQVAANEQYIVSRAGPNASACSTTYYGNTIWYLPSRAEARAQAAWLYPDQVIYVKSQSVSGAGDAHLSYELSSFTYERSNSLPLFGYPYCGFVSPVAPYQGFPTSARFIVHGLSNALLYTALQNHSSYTTGKGPNVWREAGAPGVRGAVRTVGRLSYVAAYQDVIVGMVTCFLTFPSLLLLPWFADRVLYEREEELFHMMSIAGLRASAYWLGNYLFDSFVSWLWCLALIIAGYGSGSDLFAGISPFLLLLLYLVWIHAQLGVAWLLTAFFTKRRVASVFAYLLVMVISAGSFGYAAWAYSHLTWPWYLNLIPPLTFMRALTTLLRYQPTIGQALAVGSTFANALNACLWMGTVYLIIAIVVHSLRYQTMEQLLSALPWYKASVQRRKEEQEGEHAGDERLSAAFLPLAPDADGEDEDVQLERQRVIEQQRQASAASSPAISILNLRKSFNAGGLVERVSSSLSSLYLSADARAARKSRVVNAVQGLYLGMQYGECFGLLGPNGAGKSTTLSILSGLYPPSSGRALIAGHDVENELSEVYTVLGICPQTDRVWDDLTVQQTLTFYARLKGVDRQHERALVQRIAEMVSLDGDAFGKRASTLSGGTRRRLSIAISLIGNPQVWLLDEPSTGLSAEARREVWDIVSKQKAYGRCIIITTHSMEEADTLCSRIGIVCAGRLQAIGSQARLKARFGDGFKLTLNMVREGDFAVDVKGRGLREAQAALLREGVEQDQAEGGVTRRVLRFIEERIYPGALLSSVAPKRVQFILPHASGAAGGSGGATTSLPAVLSVFDRMEEMKARLVREMRIQEWGLAHASLEEVFINIVRQAELKEAKTHED